MKRFRQSKNSQTIVSTSNFSSNTDEEDYMSMEFTIGKDENLNISKTKPLPLIGKKKVNEMMTESIIQSMSQPISSSSKGFKLLQKYGGYNEEMGGLGKSNQGIQEPLKVEVTTKQSDRSGIGGRSISTPIPSSLLIKRKNLERDAAFVDLSENYRLHVTEMNQMKKILKDIKTAEMTIYGLDNRNSVDTNTLWPKTVCEIEVCELTEKTLSSHISYNDNNHDQGSDNAEIFSIVKKDDHQLDIFHNDSVLMPTISNTKDNTDEEETIERLIQCLNYLRSTYFYCLYCGCQYSNKQDLDDQCPGVFSDDH